MAAMFAAMAFSDVLCCSCCWCCHAIIKLAIVQGLMQFQLWYGRCCLKLIRIGVRPAHLLVFCAPEISEEYTRLGIVHPD